MNSPRRQAVARRAHRAGRPASPRASPRRSPAPAGRPYSTPILLWRGIPLLAAIVLGQIVQLPIALAATVGNTAGAARSASAPPRWSPPAWRQASSPAGGGRAGTPRTLAAVVAVLLVATGYLHRGAHDPLSRVPALHFGATGDKRRFVDCDPEDLAAAAPRSCRLRTATRCRTLPAGHRPDRAETRRGGRSRWASPEMQGPPPARSASRCPCAASRRCLVPLPAPSGAAPVGYAGAAHIGLGKDREGVCLQPR